MTGHVLLGRAGRQTNLDHLARLRGTHGIPAPRQRRRAAEKRAELNLARWLFIHSSEARGTRTKIEGC